MSNKSTMLANWNIHDLNCQHSNWTCNHVGRNNQAWHCARQLGRATTQLCLAYLHFLYQLTLTEECNCMCKQRRSSSFGCGVHGLKRIHWVGLKGQQCYQVFKSELLFMLWSVKVICNISLILILRPHTLHSDHQYPHHHDQLPTAQGRVWQYRAGKASLLQTALPCPITSIAFNTGIVH